MTDHTAIELLSGAIGLTFMLACILTAHFINLALDKPKKRKTGK